MINFFCFAPDLEGPRLEIPDADAKRYRFEIDQVLKSIDSHFLYKNFSHFGQIVCLLHNFEVT